MRKSRFPSAPLAVAIAAALLAACAVGPNYHAPETRLADHFESVDSPTYATGDTVAQFGKPSPTPSSRSW
jgi:hypothetical protein